MRFIGRLKLVGSRGQVTLHPAHAHIRRIWPSLLASFRYAYIWCMLGVTWPRLHHVTYHTPYKGRLQPWLGTLVTWSHSSCVVFDGTSHRTPVTSPDLLACNSVYDECNVYPINSAQDTWAPQVYSLENLGEKRENSQIIFRRISTRKTCKPMFSKTLNTVKVVIFVIQLRKWAKNSVECIVKLTHWIPTRTEFRGGERNSDTRDWMLDL